MTPGADGMDDLVVRSAETADLDDVLAYWTSLVADQRRHGAHILPDPNAGTARDMLGQQIAAGNVIVACIDGELFGFVTFHVERGAYDQDVQRGIVENVYVTPEHRNRGIGSRLLGAAEGALAEAGVEAIAITALAENEAARRLYHERGYEPHRITFERSVADRSDTSSNRGT